MFRSILVIWLSFCAVYSNGRPQSVDLLKNWCHTKCDDMVTFTLYEECLRACYAGESVTTVTTTVTTKSKEFPKRPRNAVVNWSVQVERYTKYIRATVYWEAEEDPNREGFYLSFFPVDKQCERLFPGYYTQAIPANASSWVIPTHLPSVQPLTIAYGCAYRLELRSKPYPYGHRRYTLIEKFEVPYCVDGYCSCRNQTKLAPPGDVRVEFDTDTAYVKWRYPDFNYSDSVEFRVMLADLFRKPTVAPWKKLFKWRSWNTTVLSNKNEEEYSAVLPDVKNSLEYKVQIFAMNEHMCKSEPSEKEFIFQSTLSETGNTPRSDTTVTISADNSTANFSTAESTVVEITTIAIDENKTSTMLVTTNVEIIEFSTSTISGINRSVVTTKSGLFSRDEYFLIIFLPIIAILCLIITGFTVCKFYAARKQKLLKKQNYFEQLVHFPWTLLTNASVNPSMETNILYTEKEIIDARARGLADQYEISYERLVLGRVIGQGAFGLVYLGTGVTPNNPSGLAQVAIKQLKANADERERVQFLEEIDIMKRVGVHPNIVTMYGCCTLQYPHCMVMEYAPYGDLLRYLRNLRRQYEKQVEEYRMNLESDYIVQLNTHPLMTHAEINAGMSAADPLSSEDSETIRSACYCNDSSLEYAMIDGADPPIPFADAEPGVSAPVRPPFGNTNSDFPPLDYSLNNAELQSFAYQVACGMAHLEQLKITHRDLAARNILVGHGKTLKISDFGLSRMGIYVKTTSGRIPLRWLSIEAMRDHTYSTKSDVWAYSTLLWEICTLGGFPYPNVTDKDLMRYLENGNRLEKPASCSPAFYRLMLQCWSQLPPQRPSFAEIKRRLSEMNSDGSPYVEFAPSCQSPALPPQEYCKISVCACLKSVSQPDLQKC